MTPSITVCIPTLPDRYSLLQRAVASILQQRHAGCSVDLAIEADIPPFRGAAATRHAALLRADTEWVSFLDDDDEWLPHHLVTVVATIADYGEHLDFLHTRPVICRDGVDMPELTPLSPGQISTTVTVRRELALEVGGFTGIPALASERQPGIGAGEDGIFAARCQQAGALMLDLEEVTWRWHHHRYPGNTSGNPANVRPAPIPTALH